MTDGRLASKVLIAAAAFLLATGLTFLVGTGTTQSPQTFAGGTHLSFVQMSPAAASEAHLMATSWYHIVNGDDQCLDADSNHWRQNGDNVQLWACNNNGEQLWTVDWSAPDGPHIVNYDGQCLDADSNHWGQNGDNVQLWACNSNHEQAWDPARGVGSNAITNMWWGCLDADSNHWGQNGDNVQVWGCNGHPEENWPTS
jgi:hypothetical protein